ncbi:Cytochrome b5-related protein [Eumeta japonica]|uniref:Cytochrome b5-related protein n=1 Tax=Eumeta variegata TaxID=151549 RepID=A0A4C2AGB1_EUMVA|nr:Cytochrome b5-related protein [Eumeta japonica]
MLHHTPAIYHDGDAQRKDRDWGLYQLDTVIDRSDIKKSQFMVLTHYGDHALHHLFPTLDHENSFPNDGVFQDLAIWRRTPWYFAIVIFGEGPIKPIVPAVVEIGGIQVKDIPAPLPDDIAKHLDSANETGAVLFSLGSNLKGSSIKPEIATYIFNVLSQLKLKKQIRVKFAGGREASGILKGYDALLNLVLDNTTEYLRDPDEPFKPSEDTRNLGLVLLLMRRLGLPYNDFCRSCHDEEEEETVLHLLGTGALESLRARFLQEGSSVICLNCPRSIWARLSHL